MLDNVLADVISRIKNIIRHEILIDLEYDN